MEQRILGLDPGLATLGFGAIAAQTGGTGRSRSETVSLLDFGIIQTPAKTDLGQRLCTIYEDLHALIEQFKPCLLYTSPSPRD